MEKEKECYYCDKIWEEMAKKPYQSYILRCPIHGEIGRSETRWGKKRSETGGFEEMDLLEAIIEEIKKMPKRVIKKALPIMLNKVIKNL